MEVVIARVIKRRHFGLLVFLRELGLFSVSQDYCSASGYTCCVETRYAYHRRDVFCLVHKSDLYVKINLF